MANGEGHTWPLPSAKYDTPLQDRTKVAKLTEGDKMFLCRSCDRVYSVIRHPGYKTKNGYVDGSYEFEYYSRGHIPAFRNCSKDKQMENKTCGKCRPDKWIYGAKYANSKRKKKNGNG